MHSGDPVVVLASSDVLTSPEVLDDGPPEVSVPWGAPELEFAPELELELEVAVSVSVSVSSDAVSPQPVTARKGRMESHKTRVCMVSSRLHIHRGRHVHDPRRHVRASRDVVAEVGPTHAAFVDILSDVLRALELRGTAYFRADFRSPWGMAMETRAFSNFHLVLTGSCWCDGPEGLCPLGAGDMVVYPHGMPHRLLAEPQSYAEPAQDFLQTRRVLPGGTLEFGADGARTEIICGHFELATRSSHPLLSSLPDVVFLRSGDGQDAEWVAAATRLAAAEASSGRPGAEAVVDRLAETLMIQVIRAHGAGAGRGVGFLAALADPGVSEALRAIHADPAHSWSVEGLARIAGASRSAFASRFKALLGTAPSQYVTQWRLHLARAWLLDAQLSLAQVGERAGYASEFAFAKAFKRVFGVAPGAYRRRGADAQG